MKLAQITFLLVELASVFTYRLVWSEEGFDSSKPIFRYLTGNSKQYCKWCNMEPDKQRNRYQDLKNKPISELKPPEEIDLFDIPIYAAMTQDQGNLDKQRLSDFIGRYFN